MINQIIQIFRFILELTQKLLGCTKCKITRNKNGENVSPIETTAVVLVHCIIVNNKYQQNSRVLCTLISHDSFVNG